MRVKKPACSSCMARSCSRTSSFWRRFTFGCDFLLAPFRFQHLLLVGLALGQLGIMVELLQPVVVLGLGFFHLLARGRAFQLPRQLQVGQLLRLLVPCRPPRSSRVRHSMALSCIACNLSLA